MRAIIFLFCVTIFSIVLGIVKSNDQINSTFPLTMLKDYGPKTLSKIRWVHIPRTGVTFANTIIRYGCESITESIQLNLMSKYSDEQPWRHDPTCLERVMVTSSQNWFEFSPTRIEDAGYAVAIFRKPSDRLASQIRWMRSMVSLVTLYGVAESDVENILAIINTIPNPGSLNASHPCFKYKTKDELRTCRYLAASYFPGMKGCMTKMILGKQCAERYKLTTADLQEAKRILRDDFAFVGILEHWTETVQMFHGLHGGKLYSDELFAHYRKSPKALEVVKKSLSNTFDFFDEEIYATALEVFEKQRASLKEKVMRSGQNFY